MDADAKKKAAALAALDYVEDGMTIGVGTGSTVNHFIAALADRRHRIAGAVSSSEASTRLLKESGIEVRSLNDTGDLALYVDGADESTRHLALVKGGGGALTREKIVAAASRRFVCIVDDSKLVDVLGRFPLPIIRCSLRPWLPPAGCAYAARRRSGRWLPGSRRRESLVDRQKPPACWRNAHRRRIRQGRCRYYTVRRRP